MPRFRKRFAPRTKRSIDRDWAGLTFADGNGLASNNQVLAEWVRVPGAVEDTVQGLDMDPGNTLVHLRNRYYLEMDFLAGTIGSVTMSCFQGIIAWPGASDVGPANVLDTPLPFLSTWPWVWRAVDRWYYPVNSGGGADARYVRSNNDDPIELVDSRAMRKLGDNLGLLYIVQWVSEVAGGGAFGVGFTLLTDTTLTMKRP